MLPFASGSPADRRDWQRKQLLCKLLHHGAEKEVKRSSYLKGVYLTEENIPVLNVCAGFTVRGPALAAPCWGHTQSVGPRAGSLDKPAFQRGTSESEYEPPGV